MQESQNTSSICGIPPHSRTVVTNRHEYVNKMKVILSDTHAYTRVQEDPTKKQITTLSKTIQKLAKNGVIAPNLKKFLDPAETHCARAYGTPKMRGGTS